MKILEFKEDGVHLNGERLKFLTTFSLQSSAELDGQTTRLLATGIEQDEDGNPLVIEGRAIVYVIDEVVKVKGLDITIRNE